jgi:hypothetical protein
MGRSIKIAPGIHLNVSKSGLSTSIGTRGATVNIGPKGTRGTVGIPGTGISYSDKLSPTAHETQRSESTEYTRNGWVLWAALAGLALIDLSP